MYKKFLFWSVFFLLLFIATARDLTDEEQKLFRDDGLKFSEELKIDNRYFKPLDNKGFVKRVETNHFLVKNVKITSSQDIIVNIPDKETHVVFKEGEFNLEKN